jgi:gliding motility-associated-like protein
LNVVSTSVTASNDTSICIGNSVNLNAQGNGTVTWSPSTYLNTTQGNVVTATPDTTTMYIATLTTAEGCISTDTVWVYVYFTPPSSNLPDTVILCEGTSTTLTAAGANSYLWSPNVYISSTVGPTVTLNPPQSLYYYCAFTNACGTLIDSVFINVLTANVTAQGDTIICPGGEAFLSAYGGITYQWTPNASVVNQTANIVWVKPLVSTLYQVVGTDINGCKDTAFVEVVLHPWPSISISPNIQAFYGDQIQLNAVGNSPGSYVWSPGEYLSCINCPNPVATPDQDITYTISFTDENGCNTDANVSITYEAVIYIPNSFIPDGNGRNDLFGVFGGNISSMEMLLFDRWGELIYTLHSLDDRWDGTYEGNKCPDGVYTWKLIYTDTQFKKNELKGHVVLLR